MNAVHPTPVPCRHCTGLTVCVICGKGYADAVRADAVKVAERQLRAARDEYRRHHGEDLHPLDECQLHPGNRRRTCEHCEASQ